MPCAALYTASWVLFRKTCENHLQNLQHSDLRVTLLWPDAELTMFKGFVTIHPDQPIQNLGPDHTSGMDVETTSMEARTWNVKSGVTLCARDFEKKKKHRCYSLFFRA